MALKCIINHIGFQPHVRKKVIIPGTGYTYFEIQDMQQVVKEEFNDRENWKAVLKGELVSHHSDFGDFLVGDFSGLTKPGTYRVVVNDAEHWSYQFTISPGVFMNLPFLFLDFIHNWRSGKHGLHWRESSNLDDAIRSDTGEQIDVSGGWYDAGDLRKWMVHTNLPVSGFLDISSMSSLTRNAFANEGITDNDFLTETAWALNFMLKMQDRQTGMFYEDVAGGGSARVSNDLKWWYENHAGCVADNSENHFTDNLLSSGDERSVRVSYNPIVQYTTIYLLLKASRLIAERLPALASGCRKAALRCWKYMTGKQQDKDPFHNWTSVISWKLMAMTELITIEEISQDAVILAVMELCELQSEEFGFWFMDMDRKDPYRGILHSAQPIIALCLAHERIHESSVLEKISEALLRCTDKYVRPATALTPFGFMPYGFYFKPASEEVYHPFGDKLYFRFFMPDKSPQKLNHGLNGHWMSWAHGMALAGRILNDETLADIAWDQIYWTLGNNPVFASLVSGVGYNNPMPHSRFFGSFPGGFMVGFIGDQKDRPVLDLEGRAQWNTTEYWNTPLANCLMALAELGRSTW